MIQQAIASDDPVIFFEPKRRYWEKGEVDTDPGPASDPLYDGARRCARAATSRSSATGRWSRPALDAAAAAAEEGRELEVIDLRSLSPLDLDTVAASVEQTGRLVVVHEAPTFRGIGAEIAARVTERCFYSLEAPVLRVGGFDTAVPAVAGRGGLPARPRPRPRRRRPLARATERQDELR